MSWVTRVVQRLGRHKWMATVVGRAVVPLEIPLTKLAERQVDVVPDAMRSYFRDVLDHALRVRDPQAPTRTGFAGVPAFPVDERWVVDARFEPFAEPRRITVGAVVEGLHHFPIAVGTVRFTLDGTPQELVALAGRDGGLSLHFRDATSGDTTYGGTADQVDPGANLPTPPTPSLQITATGDSLTVSGTLQQLNIFNVVTGSASFAVSESTVVVQLSTAPNT